MALASSPLPVDFLLFTRDEKVMHAMIIAGGCMFLIGTFLTLFPIISKGVGPGLLLIGGLTSMADVFLR
jgi:hypothetical protein